jgi:hypothetical protein
MQGSAFNYFSKFFFLFVILFGLSGCFSFKESVVDFSIQDPEQSKDKKNLHAWIKIVNLPEYNHDIPKENVNAFITYKLYKFLRETNQFESVHILYSKETKLPSNSILLEFQFSKLEEKDKFHAMYFPFGIIGLGIGRYLTRTNYGFLLFTAFGGPDSVHQINYTGNLIAYDSKDQEKARTRINFQSEFNSNMLYYDKTTETNIKRKEMFLSTLQSLLRQWEGK